MTITNTWAIVRLDCYPELGGNADVVSTAHWTLTATDGTYSTSSYGSAGVTLDPDKPFTAYADLTETEVVGWVQDALGNDAVAELEANVATQLENQINPPIVTPPLPWSAHADLTETETEVVELEANVATQIENQIDPPVVTPPVALD